MITREEYIKALDIVESYHEQLSKNKKITKTLIIEWDKLDRCSGRLKNALILLPTYHVNYIEDITNEDFSAKLRNIGKKTWKEFVQIRDSNL